MRTILAVMLILTTTVVSGCGSDDCYSTGVCAAPLPPPAPIVRPVIAPTSVVPAPQTCDPCTGI